MWNQIWVLWRLSLFHVQLRVVHDHVARVAALNATSPASLKWELDCWELGAFTIISLSCRVG